MRYGNFQKVVDAVITSFFSNLIFKAYKKEILSDEIFLSNLLEFLNCMSYTTFKPFRTTGVILGKYIFLSYSYAFC